MLSRDCGITIRDQRLSAALTERQTELVEVTVGGPVSGLYLDRGELAF